MFHFNLIIMKKVLTQVIHNGAKVLMSLRFTLCLVMNLACNFKKGLALLCHKVVSNSLFEFWGMKMNFTRMAIVNCQVIGAY